MNHALIFDIRILGKKIQLLNINSKDVDSLVYKT
jgi:hypothetical protein